MQKLNEYVPQIGDRVRVVVIPPGDPETAYLPIAPAEVSESGCDHLWHRQWRCEKCGDVHVEHPEVRFSSPSAERDGWIAVDERLPNAGDWVLACDWDNVKTPEGYWIQECWSGTPFPLGCIATHWQPLPSPPAAPSENTVRGIEE